jgi:hypothetical protein
MSGVVKRVEHKYTVPPEVRQYMQGNVEEVTWSFIDPTDALVRMLVLSPLAGTLRVRAVYFNVNNTVCMIFNVTTNALTQIFVFCLNYKPIQKICACVQGTRSG